MEAVYFVLMCLWLAVPGALANMMPVFAKNIDFLNYPVDFGKQFRGKRLFGANKTFRGFFFGILGAIVVAYFQARLFGLSFFQKIAFIDFSTTSFVLFGFLIGFGVLFGDLVESFFKRQFDIAPGKPWFPWDQVDLLIGALVFISFIRIPTWQMIAFFFAVGPLLHLGFNYLGYALGIKKNKW